jgi:cytoskeleton protein RodZ
LSREEVAQRLHLAPRQIVALENDDYGNLPGPTYVRGYLRSYAELVGLPPQRVLGAYASLSASNRTPNLSSLAPKEEITSQHHQMKFTTYVVIALVIGLAVAWWQGRELEVKPATETTARPQAESGTALVPTSGADSVLVPGTLGAPGDVTSPPGTLSPEVAGLTPGASAPLPPASPSPSRSIPTPEAHAAAKPSADIRPTPIASVDSTESPAPPRVPTTAVPEVRRSLVVYTDEECWIDVRDAHKNKLLYETVPAGRRVVLDGVVPFSIFLGNATGVRLEYDGKPFDITPYKRGLIARFTLGRAQAAPPPTETSGQ